MSPMDQDSNSVVQNKVSEEIRAMMPDLNLSINHGDYEHGYSQGLADALGLVTQLEADHARLTAQVAKLQAKKEDFWDQNCVRCGNCSVEIITRKGSIANNNGLSDVGGSEDESLCGRCAGSQMYTYEDQIAAITKERDELQAKLDARWQPIETAPKDKDLLLLGIGADGRPMRVIARWECAAHAFSSSAHRPNSDCDFRWLGELGTKYGVPFTNWQPIPDPPKEPAK